MILIGNNPDATVVQLALGPSMGFSSLLAIGQRLTSTIHDVATGFVKTIMRDREREGEKGRERERQRETSPIRV